MLSSEVRDRYLEFFERHGHLRLNSASLVPASFDPSVLLNTAGMQPLKPFFQGLEKPPASRLTSCQKCFRTTDIEQVGLTARHLTFFEMLGNFSIGDYFKEEAIAFGWQLSLEVFGFTPERIWVTVFAGDEELKLGPDDEAVRYWLAAGVPQEQIVHLSRKDNFWQAGPTGPCGPCSELYLDRGLDFGSADDRPGDDTERFLEYWNLVFMQYQLQEDGSLNDLPSCNIDTGLGLERMASIIQGVDSVFETDLLKPLIELGEELSGSSYVDGGEASRALRVLADHSRGVAFLTADGVVPSNEDRGYILRRIIRRAVQQGRSIDIEPPFLSKFTECVIEQMGDAYPELREQRRSILKWVEAEEEGFLKTLDQGTELLSRLIAETKEVGSAWIPASEAFKLHDTYGFPYDLTKEILAQQGLAVDDQGFNELMEAQRERARSGSATAHGSQDSHDRVNAFVKQSGFETEFVGYSELEVDTTVAALETKNGTLLVKLPESPFYAEGGGQVADSGRVEGPSGSGLVVDVYRVAGSDQVVEVELERGDLKEGDQIRVAVDRKARHATACNHTATHLLHAALRQCLGDHVRQAGSAVRPDKLRFDFTHGAALTADELKEVEDLVNRWISESWPVRALEMPRTEAERLGAMALFGEKYGEWVRMVEVDGVSRELCGGTHLSNTAEAGLFKITTETSSAANVRRIEALTGPLAIEHFLKRDRQVKQLSLELKTTPDALVDAVEKLQVENRQFGQRLKGPAGGDQESVARLIESADKVGTFQVVATSVEGADSKGLRELADRVASKLGDCAVILAAVEGDRFAVTAKFSPSVVEQGLAADRVLAAALEGVGGRGGGRETMAQGGGSDPSKLEVVLQSALVEIKSALG